MNAFYKILGGCAPFLASLWLSASEAQDTNARPTRPIIRGRHDAVTSMKPEATWAAQKILQAGGNAFDAIVAGQAALSVVDAASNGVGSDAVILIYDARARKVWSLNAEGTAPKLATIEWYQKNNGGKLPVDDGLLAGTVPGVVDAWYLMLDRWGTMSFAQVLAPAIDLAENGFPIGNGLARAIAGSKKLKKYPSSVKVYYPNGQAPQAGEVFRNPDLARTLKKLVEAEKRSRWKGRHKALQAARDRFYKGDIARAMAKFSEENGGLFRYEDFANYTAKIEEPVFTEYRGCQVYKNPSANQGPAELFALNILEGYDLKGLRLNSTDYIHTCIEAIKLAFADREKFLGDMDFIRIPFEGLLSKEYAAERRKLIDPDRASLELRPGSPEGFVKVGAARDRFENDSQNSPGLGNPNDAFPSPRPSPTGRGRIVSRAGEIFAALSRTSLWQSDPLSPRERAGVRGNGPENVRAPRRLPDVPIIPNFAGEADHEGDTSYIAVVDKHRNMVSFTPSLHSGFGTGVVLGELGFILNCRGDYYSLTPGHANALEPGKRPRSTLQSTLVMKERKPHMVMGSPGGDDQIMRTMQTFLNMVEFGMDVQRAIEAPRWTTRSFPASPFPHTMYPGDMSVESRVSESARQALIAKGHKLRVSNAWSMGNNAAIVVDLKNGTLSAGADPRCDAYAWAW